MGSAWKRTRPFLPTSHGIESWVCGDTIRDVAVTYGKKLDIHAIRGKEVYETERKSFESVRNFFDKVNDFEKIKSCPVCNTKSDSAIPAVKIFDITYLSCSSCGHAYCDISPTQAALSKFYTENLLGNTYYTNPEQIDIRINQIYTPKLEWIIKAYTETFGSPPKTILDLGAGSGHFLEASKRKGLKVAGFEIDETYRKWAKDTFGLELFGSPDLISKKHSEPFDIVTSFNVIEHISNPNEFMELYERFSGSKTLIIVETPRFNSFTSSLQKIFPHRIRGHLMPFIHVQLFSDQSLLTLLMKHGFAPRHAWFFGQDVTELFYHLSAELDADVIPLLKDLFNPLQEAFDMANVSNLMIFAGTKV